MKARRESDEWEVPIVKKQAKRILSFTLAVLMMVSMLTGIVLPASAETVGVVYADAAPGDLLYTVNFNFDEEFKDSSFGITTEEYSVSGENGERVTISNKAAGSDFLSGRLANYRIKGNVYTLSYYIENSDWSAIRVGPQFIQHDPYRIGFVNAKDGKWKLYLNSSERDELLGSVVAKTDAQNNNRRYFKTVVDGTQGLMFFYVLGEAEEYRYFGQVDLDTENLLFLNDYFRFGLFVPDAVGEDQAVSLGDVQLFKGNTVTEKTTHQTAYDAAEDGDVLYNVNFSDVASGDGIWETFMATEKADGISVGEDGSTLTLSNSYGAKQYVAAALQDKTAAHYGSMTYEFYLESNERMGTWLMGNNAGGAADHREGFVYFSDDQPALGFMVKNDWFTLEEYNAGGAGYIDRNIYRGTAVVESQFGAETGCDSTPDTGEGITCNVKVEFDAVNKKMTTYILKDGVFKRTYSLYYAGTTFYPQFGAYTYYNGTEVTFKNFVIKKGLTSGVQADERGISLERMTCRDGNYSRSYPTENYYSDPLYLDTLPRSFGAWVKLDDKGYNAINHAFSLRTNNAASVRNVALEFAGGVPTMEYGNISWTVSDVKLLPDTWTHIAFTFDSENQKLNCYINGSLAAVYEGDVLTDLNGEPGFIYLLGDDGHLECQFNRHALSGALGDVFLYDDLRTEAELAEDMLTADTADEELTAYYKLFDAEEGNDVVDHSGNGLDVECGATWLTEEEMEAKRAEDPNEYVYSIAVLPDTQKMLNYPAGFVKTFDWLLAEKDNNNIKFVLNLGDMTDQSQTDEWELVKGQHDRLNDIIPYNVLQGNHDTAATINATFGDKEGYYYQSVAANGGFYNEDSVLHTYQLFTAGNTDYIILNIGYDNNQPVLDWGSEILEKYADRKAIVVTHYLMDARYSRNDSIWQMVKKHSNVVLYLGGHCATDRVVHRADVGDHGNVIHQILINPQSTDSYMDGLGGIGMLYFTEDGEDVSVEMYSAVHEKYYREQSQFTFSYDCYDAPADGDHACDACGAENITVCVNEIKDHVCDTDGKCAVYTTGEYAHADSDADHFCEVCGLGVKSDICTDAENDGDHKCDICDADEITACADAASDGDHKCDECGETYYYTYIPDFTSKSNGTTLEGYAGGIKYTGPITANTYTSMTQQKPTLQNRRYEMNYWVKTDGNKAILSFVYAIYGSNAAARMGWEVGKDLTTMYYVGNSTNRGTITTPTRDVVDGKQYFKAIFNGTDSTMSLYVLSGGEYVLADTRAISSYTGFVTAPYIRANEVGDGETLEIGGINIKEICADVAGDGNHKCDECGAADITACTDAAGDGDHKCDECGLDGVTACADVTDDEDHFCDECGLGVKGADCTDVTGDGDHKCDVCAADKISACTDAADDADHLCDDCAQTYYLIPDFSGSSNGTTIFGYAGGIKYVGDANFAVKTYKKVTADYTANRKYEITYAMTDRKGTALSVVYGKRSASAGDARLGWWQGGNLTDMVYYYNGTAIQTVTGPERDVVDGKQYFKVILDGVSMTMTLYVLSGGEYVQADSRQLYGITRFLFGTHNQYSLGIGEVLEVSDISVRELCSDADADHKCDVCAAELPELHQESELIVDTAATVTTDGVGHTECTVCGKTMQSGVVIPKAEATGEAYIGDTAYATLAEALAAVKSGETVTLYADVTVSNLVINPAITLDLNGKTLTADYMVAFDDSAVIDSAEAGGGKIAVPANRMILSKNNPQLPVYDEENGCYLFTRVKNDRFELTTEGGKPKYSTSPMFKDYAHSFLNTEAKAAASGVDVIIRLTWIDSEGQYVGTQDYTYLDSSIAEVMASYVSENGTVNYGKQFYGIFVGSEIESGVSVTVSTVVRSVAGVEMVSSALPLFA